MSSFYVTTPIYYVNGDPHLGHAYTTIVADAAVRHARQRGEDGFLLTGTDEHGGKIEQAAAAAGIDPKTWADPIAARFRALFARADVENDFFIRTTDPEHEAFVGRFVERMRESGDLFEGTYAGFYCTACERFYDEAELVEGACPEHGIPVSWLEEQNTFFRLSAYAERLLRHYDEHPDFVLPRARMNETRSFVAGGLDDISITRQSISWGVPLPWAPDQAIYVWIDALLNYLSALTYARPGQDLTARLWPARWQLMSKDILRFHAIIWPAMLMAAGYELPRQLFIHGTLLGHDGYAMSKTRRNALDPVPALDTYGSDALRYYLLREVSFGSDGAIGYRRLHERYHAELANELGNLVSRTLAMVGRYRGGRLPAGEVDVGISGLAASVAERYATAMRTLDFSAALDAAWELVRALNRHVEERAPWVLAREGEASAAALDTTLRTLVEGIHVIAVLLWNVLPRSCSRVLRALGDEEGVPRLGDDGPQPSAPGVQLDTEIGSLFPRVEHALS